MPIQNISGHNYFIREPIFKLLVAHFRTRELQKDGMVIFFLWCFRKVRFRKMQFLKDGDQTVGDKRMYCLLGVVDRYRSLCPDDIW